MMSNDLYIFKLCLIQFAKMSDVVYVEGLLMFYIPLPLLRDRFRTATNVLGDSIGAGIVEHLSRHELLKKDPELCSSVVEEVPKKSYHLVCQENDCENQAHPDSETKM